MTDNQGIKVLALDIDGVFTDGTVELAADGVERKRIFYRDLDAVGAALRQGLNVVLVTGESTDWVDAFSRRLGLSKVYKGAKDKLAAMERIGEDFGVGLQQICYVGDSDRDAPALHAVGQGMAPADASRLAREGAAVVLGKSGGHGAVEEAVHRLLEM